MSQLERLRKDIRDLDHYIFKLQKKGNSRLAHKIMIKRDFLKQHIQEYRG